MSFFNLGKTKNLEPSKNLELSVSEIDELTLGKPSKDSGRLVMLSCELRPFRFVPKAVYETAKELYDKKEITILGEYLESAFFIYRGSVCSDWNAPLYCQEGVYEWPALSSPKWNDASKIISLGRLIRGKTNVPTIETRKGDYINVTELDITTGEHTKHAREAITSRDDLNKTLKYFIADKKELGFVFSQSWQNYTLRNFANPASYIFLRAQNLSMQTAIDEFSSLMQRMQKTTQIPIGVIVKSPRDIKTGEYMFWE